MFISHKETNEVTIERNDEMVTEEIDKENEIENTIIKVENRKYEDLLIAINSNRV